MQPAPARGEQSVAGKGEGQTPHGDTGKGKGKDNGLGYCDMSDTDRFRAQLCRAVTEQVPLKPEMSEDPLFYFMTACQHVDNWDQTGSAEGSHNWREVGIRPDAFNPLQPACPDTNKFGLNVWGAQLAAMLRMFHGDPAYAMTVVYKEAGGQHWNPIKRPCQSSDFRPATKPDPVHLQVLLQPAGTPH